MANPSDVILEMFRFFVQPKLYNTIKLEVVIGWMLAGYRISGYIQDCNVPMLPSRLLQFRSSRVFFLHPAYLLPRIIDFSNREFRQ